MKTRGIRPNKRIHQRPQPVLKNLPPQPIIQFQHDLMENLLRQVETITDMQLHERLPSVVPGFPPDLPIKEQLQYIIERSLEEGIIKAELLTGAPDGCIENDRPMQQDQDVKSIEGRKVDSVQEFDLGLQDCYFGESFIARSVEKSLWPTTIIDWETGAIEYKVGDQVWSNAEVRIVDPTEAMKQIDITMLAGSEDFLRKYVAKKEWIRSQIMIRGWRYIALQSRSVNMISSSFDYREVTTNELTTHLKNFAEEAGCLWDGPAEDQQYSGKRAFKAPKELVSHESIEAYAKQIMKQFKNHQIDERVVPPRRPNRPKRGSSGRSGVEPHDSPRSATR